MKKANVKEFLDVEGKKLMFYHTDTDGISSASIFLKSYPDFETIPLEGPILSDRFLKQLADIKPALIVILDIPLDQEWQKLDKFMKECPKTRILMIDHHIPDKDMNSARFIHLNPRMEKVVYIPTSVLVYRLMKDIGHDARPYLWIAAVGVIGDHAFEDCADVLDAAEKEYPGAVKGENSDLAKISDRIMATVIYHGVKGAEKSIGYMRGMEKYGDALKNKYFMDCHDRVEGEIKSKVSAFNRKAKEYPNLGLCIYRIDSPLSIASSISTRIADKHPDKMIFVVKKSKQMMKISARYQKGDISLNDLLKETVAGIGSGGGHIKAAGAVVPVKDWKEFEERLFRRLEELRSKPVS